LKATEERATEILELLLESPLDTAGELTLGDSVKVGLTVLLEVTCGAIDAEELEGLIKA
jgi:hypothetical protein